MENIDPEKLRELYPQAWWAGYRKGVAELRADPNFRKEAAEAYLKGELVRGSSSAATAQPLSVSPRQPLPQAPAATAAADLEQARAAGRFVQQHLRAKGC